MFIFMYVLTLMVFPHMHNYISIYLFIYLCVCVCDECVQSRLGSSQEAQVMKELLEKTERELFELKTLMRVKVTCVNTYVLYISYIHVHCTISVRIVMLYQCLVRVTIM